MMTAPFLGCVPFLDEPSADNAANFLHCEALLKRVIPEAH
ncbi:MAG TPA: dethiobiotin synthase, partial [Shewanella sp.]|nr:dethiobiotin synthase [Shewanella sp.]